PNDVFAALGKRQNDDPIPQELVARTPIPFIGVRGTSPRRTADLRNGGLRYLALEAEGVSFPRVGKTASVLRTSCRVG
ncbi:MAG: hypothetical protein LAN62_17360, partial [Acidobacteriia bacterium]|nr:hypothetical protein [Terriglobia bacterium]